MVHPDAQKDSTHDLEAVLGQFRMVATLRTIVRFGHGHINDTYCAVVEEGTRYILQRINHEVFKNPAAVMSNVQRVTAHLQQKLGRDRDPSRSVLTLVPAVNGGVLVHDQHGCTWRVYLFVENTHTCQAVESTEQAYEVARAFGQFQGALADLGSPRLHETIVDFHNTPKRFQALEEAAAADLCDRAKLAANEIAFAFRRKPMAATLTEAHLPERIVHNDAKLNNVLLDDSTGEAMCVVDLDTVMPGLAAHDFGDLVRTSTSPAAEDELDLAKVTLQLPMFEALVRGYLSSAGGFLTQSEIECLPLAGKLITFEQGLRFLTDFLVGDTYFRASRPFHNLQRCRTQFKLVESIEQQEAEMGRIVSRAYSRGERH